MVLDQYISFDLMHPFYDKGFVDWFEVLCWSPAPWQNNLLSFQNFQTSNIGTSRKWLLEEVKSTLQSLRKWKCFCSSSFCEFQNWIKMSYWMTKRYNLYIIPLLPSLLIFYLFSDSCVWKIFCSSVNIFWWLHWQK